MALSLQKCKCTLLQEITQECISKHSLPIEAETPNPEPPWTLLTPNTNIELTNRCNKDNPSLNKKEALQLISQYPDYSRIYTDGSKIEEKSGCGIYIPSIKLLKSIRLPNFIDIFTAEAHAIYNAVTIIMGSDIQKAIILSDSYSVISAVRNFSSNWYIQDIISIINDAKLSGIEIILTWIPSHCNIPGNEKADKLAKEAIKYDHITSIPYTLKHHYLHLQQYISHIWQNEWNTYSATHFYSIQPKIKNTFSYFCSDMFLNKIVTSIAINNPPLRKYKSYFNKSISPFCPTCKQTETTHHYIFKCKRYQKQRQKLKTKLNNNKLTFTMNNIFNNSTAFIYFIDYIKQTKRFETLNSL